MRVILSTRETVEGKTFSNFCEAFETLAEACHGSLFITELEMRAHFQPDLELNTHKLQESRAC